VSTTCPIATDALRAATLNDRDVQMFANIGVPIDLLEEAHIERVSDRDARERFGITGPTSKNMAGIIFPYYSPFTGHRVTARARRDNPEFENDKPKDKYISAHGDGRHLYFPPDARDKLQEPSTPIVLVEAEKSVLALTAWSRRTSTDVIPVGMGGCWGWRGRIGKTVGINGERVDVEARCPIWPSARGGRCSSCLIQMWPLTARYKRRATRWSESWSGGAVPCGCVFCPKSLGSTGRTITLGPVEMTRWQRYSITPVPRLPVATLAEAALR